MKPPAGVSGRTLKLWEELQEGMAESSAYHQPITEERQRTHPIDSPAPRPVHAPLAHRVNAQADAGSLAGAIVAVWQEVDVALTPIVGPRGFAALYKRSVFVTALVYPWLMGVHDNALASVNLSDLSSVFKRQSLPQAHACAATLFDTFHDLLVSMVGPSLTERLLRSVWADASGGPSTKDLDP